MTCSASAQQGAPSSFPRESGRIGWKYETGTERGAAVSLFASLVRRLLIRRFGGVAVHVFFEACPRDLAQVGGAHLRRRQAQLLDRHQAGFVAHTAILPRAGA